MIIGIDEVGRGCWAGPLLAAAVELDMRSKISGLRDSKKMTRLQREKAVPLIKQNVIQYGIGWVWPEQVDLIGLTKAVQLAMQRAVDQLVVDGQKVIIDGNLNYLEHISGSSCLIKADDKIPAVAAASVLAKVARDNYMQDMSVKYPGYLFEKNVGYGTKHHVESLKKLGVTPIHRKSYAPIKAVI